MRARANLPYAALQHRVNAKRFAEFAQIRLRTAILHDRVACDDLEVGNLRQANENVVVQPRGEQLSPSAPKAQLPV